ncbi:MAG TPA: tRNA isopentenyl-2-thiomethyl-A-37 hydroxylase MiaE [Polyangia bacterium]|jgi:tRNA-(ms[2]io[6]A)-hydroxylase|nr:tRNA isopentenyl-2-thiomethyl-A-37 hydroxylase MiaE [Polyangia bacterium]
MVSESPRSILRSCTHPAWFARSSGDLLMLLSDHLHCERKAAENALSLVRRYPHRGPSVTLLGRLAHEETSHVVQVAALIGARGWVPRADTPNQYARGLMAEIRGAEPARLLDSLLAAAFIEARSHERLGFLAAGFERVGEDQLADFYRALAGAEERHAEIFLELAAPLVSLASFDDRLSHFAAREAEILAALPHGPRIH